jgi:hypothetical protein
MAKTTKTFLALGIGSVVPGLVINAGLVNVTNVEGLYVLLPLGVILLGMFFISRLLEKESVEYDRQHRQALAAADASAPAAAEPTQPSTSGPIRWRQRSGQTT